MSRVSVAGVRTFVEGSKSGTVHVGVDVYKRKGGLPHHPLN